MGRPLGSKNVSKAAPAAPVVTAVSSAEATTETAAANGIKRQYREGGAQMVIPKSNSSAFLFGEPAPEEKPAEEFHVEQPINEPVAEQPQAPQPEQVQEQPAGEQKNLTPETEEVIYIEDFLKKMNIDPSKVKTKTKVDGVEADVPFLEVKKSYQLEQHLTKRGQKIGEERRRLEEERNRLMASQTPQAAPEEPTSEVEFLRRKLEALESVIQPTIYQNARQQLAEELKSQGFPDFNDYIGKIEARVAAEPDDNKWKFYNTFDGAKQVYFQLKAEEAMNPSANKPTIPAAPKKEATRPPVIKIDGGNRPSQPVVDDYAIKMNELLAKWKENPAKNKHLLQEILRMKDALYLK